MGARSIIGVELASGIIRAVYVHFDGFLAGVGQELQAYHSQAAVEELVSLGDRLTTTSGFYRDRGEIGAGPVDCADTADFFLLANECDAGWVYLFQGGQWLCAKNYDLQSPLYRTLTPYAQACHIDSWQSMATENSQ